MLNKEVDIEKNTLDVTIYLKHQEAKEVSKVGGGLEMPHYYYNDNEYYLNTSAYTASVLYYQNSPTNVEIPAVVKFEDIRYIVTGIDASAFNGCKTLTKITLPNSIIEISLLAFANSGLSSFKTPKALMSIGNSSFYGCSNLESFRLYNNITSIESGAFSDSAIINIKIPFSVTTIASSAFSDCDSLRSVVFANITGWSANGENLDLSNPEQNAVYLKETYRDYYWQYKTN